MKYLLLLVLVTSGCRTTDHTNTKLNLINAPKTDLYPFVGGIYYHYRNKSGDTVGNSQCSAVKICSRLILTANHCLNSLQKIKMSEDVIGEVSFTFRNGKEVIYLSEKQFEPHPQADANTFYDVAAVGLPVEAKNTSIPDVSKTVLENMAKLPESVTLVGYGITSESPPEGNGERHAATLPVHGKSSMLREEGYTADKGEYVILVEKSDRNIIGCDGDSGGAAIIEDSEGNSKLIGLIESAVDEEMIVEEGDPWPPCVDFKFTGVLPFWHIKPWLSNKINRYCN